MVSFIIINYNTNDVTTRCVESIHRFVTGEPFEIIVIDNASKPEDLNQLKRKTEGKCTLISCRFNNGFGLGNMLGANIAKGDYLCFLNNDTFLHDDCVSPLCEYLRQNPNVGCITPQQLDAKGMPVPSFNHRLGLLHLLFPNGWFEKLNPEKYPPRYDFSRKQPFLAREINGSFMLFPTETFWKIGGFDTNIFLYVEEYDIGMRLAKIGKTCAVHPKYAYNHHHAASTGKVKRATNEERKISKIYVYSKHHRLLKSHLYAFLLIFTQVVMNPHRWYQLPYLLSPDPMSKSMRKVINRNLK